MTEDKNKTVQNNRHTAIVGFAREETHSSESGSHAFTDAYIELDQVASALNFYDNNDLLSDKNQYTNDVSCNIRLIKMRKPKGTYTHCLVIAPDFRKLSAKEEGWEPPSASQTSVDSMDDLL